MPQASAQALDRRIGICPRDQSPDPSGPGRKDRKSFEAKLGLRGALRGPRPKDDYQRQNIFLIIFSNYSFCFPALNTSSKAGEEMLQIMMSKAFSKT
jgi:hypothetical protein